MEISRRHGLSSVASTIAALPGPQYLTEIARLHRFINIANDRRHSQAVDPNAFFDLEPEYLGLHPIPEPADFTYPQPGGAPPVDLTTPADSGCRPCRGSRFTTLVRFTTQSVLPELLAQAELTSEANELRSNSALGWADPQLMLRQVGDINELALWDDSTPLPSSAQNAARITANHASCAAWHVRYAHNILPPRETTSSASSTTASPSAPPSRPTSSTSPQPRAYHATTRRSPPSLRPVSTSNEAPPGEHGAAGRNPDRGGAAHPRPADTGRNSPRGITAPGRRF